MSNFLPPNTAFAYLSKLFNALTVVRHHKLVTTYAKLNQVMLFIFYQQENFRFPSMLLQPRRSNYIGYFYKNQLVPHAMILAPLARYSGVYLLITSKSLSKGQTSSSNDHFMEQHIF